MEPPQSAGPLPVVALPPPALAPSGAPPADPSVRFGEMGSQLSSWRAPLIAVLVMASAIWLWGPDMGNRGGRGALTFMIMFVPGLYLVIVVLMLPRGIVIRDGLLRVGARGLPVLSAIEGTQRLPLDAVYCWDVITRGTFGAHRAGYEGASRKFSGNMLTNMPRPGARHILWLQADVRFVRVTFPRYVARRHHITSPADYGYFTDGRILVGTRRPKALVRALEKAIPGRRLSAPPPIADMPRD